MSLADLSRRQTAQPADLAATMELARRSTASSHRASHAGGEHEGGEAPGTSHVRQSVLGEAAAGGHSRRPSVFGDASLAVAHHRLSVLGPGHRASMLGGAHRPSAMGGPRMSMLGHAGDHRASMLGGQGEHSHGGNPRLSMLGGQDHPAPVAEQEEEEAPVELTPEQVGQKVVVWLLCVIGASCLLAWFLVQDFFHWLASIGPNPCPACHFSHHRSWRRAWQL